MLVRARPDTIPDNDCLKLQSLKHVVPSTTKATAVRNNDISQNI